MAKRFVVRKLFALMSAAGLMGFNQCAMASAFQLWEQDGASIGNYHAGAAAIAEDASTAFYNPAGLVRIKNQQVVVGGDAIVTDIRFKGTVAVNTLPDLGTVSAQGGGFSFVPDMHYAAPITSNTVFGLSISVPFGLKTDYGQNTMLRYAATKSSVQVIDFSPSLAYAINQRWSVGLGLDIQRMNGEFDQFATLGDPSFDTVSNNTGSDTAYGYHAGILFQMTPDTRVGLSYRSQVVHHLRGSSKFNGTLANFGDFNPSGVQLSSDFTGNMTLPPITILSLFHTVNPVWDVMGTISYVQWGVFQDFILKNVAGIQMDPNVGIVSTNNLSVVVHQGYRNSWNYAVGTNYHPNEKWMLRAGLGFDQTPSSDKYRNVQLPDADRIAIGLGAHYQASKTIGLDVGWTHLFAMNTRINNLTQTTGIQTSTTSGSVNASADVYGAQLKWDIL